MKIIIAVEKILLLISCFLLVASIFGSLAHPHSDDIFLTFNTVSWAPISLILDILPSKVFDEINPYWIPEPFWLYVTSTILIFCIYKYTKSRIVPNVRS